MPYEHTDIDIHVGIADWLQEKFVDGDRVKKTSQYFCEWLACLIHMLMGADYFHNSDPG